MARTSCKTFCHDRLGSFQVIRIWIFSHLGLKVLFTAPKLHFWGDFIPQNLGAHRSDPQRHFLARNDAFWALIDLDLTHSATSGLGKVNKKKEKRKRQWQTGYSPRPPTSPYRSQSLHAWWPPACSSIFQVILKSVQSRAQPLEGSGVRTPPTFLVTPSTFLETPKLLRQRLCRGSTIKPVAY